MKDPVSYRWSYKGETAELLVQPEAEDRNPVRKLYRILIRSALMPSLSKNSIPASTHLPKIRHLV